MDTIVKALIKFYQKLGGTPSDLRLNATAADVIDAISDTYTDKEGTHVEVSTELSEGTKVATVTTNNTEHDIYAPTPDSVSVTAELSEGTKVATVTINNVGTDIYAPAGGGGSTPIVVDVGEYLYNSGECGELSVTYNEVVQAIKDHTPIFITGTEPLHGNIETIQLTNNFIGPEDDYFNITGLVIEISHSGTPGSSELIFNYFHLVGESGSVWYEQITNTV